MNGQQASIAQEITNVKVEDLLLDPNNYRFIDNKNYKEVSKEHIINEAIQRRTLNFLIGEKRKGVEDLIKSFKANGFLKVDQIQAEQLAIGKYRVLEGNRRVSALKVMAEDYRKEGIDLEKLDPSIFDAVPIVTYGSSNTGEHEIIMGLKHISGNKKWPPYNQAQLIFDLLNKHDWDETRACESLGITKHELRRNLRTVSLINDYRKSDFADQFETDMFGIFREIIASTNLKVWMGWDDVTMRPTNPVNTERLYGWLSKVYETKEDTDGEDINIERERIITKSAEVSTLAKIVDDPEALKELEEKRNIADAYSASTSVGDDKYLKALENVEINIDDANLFAKYAKDIKKEKLIKLKDRLEGLMVGQGFKDIIISKGMAKRILIDYKTDQFTSITLQRYKGFCTELKIKNLNRINLFTGENNVGKSSLLEAVFLLANLNDINELVELYRRRAKFSEKIPVHWINNEFVPFHISAEFDNKTIELKASQLSEEDPDIEKSGYLSTIQLDGSFNNEIIPKSIVRLFNHKPTEQYFEQLKSTCPSSYSSPFTMLSKELINEYHEESVKKGTYDRIVSFLKKYVDTNIEAITKVGDYEQVRFLVKHANFQQGPVDLMQFGEGLQRIFFISLQLATAQNGILCIDEIENAIHHSLLVKFTKFIQILAEEYNVQLFITTHSSECIKAFFENGYQNNHITGYRLINTLEGVRYKAASGRTLQNQIETFNLDLRG